MKKYFVPLFLICVFFLTCCAEHNHVVIVHGIYDLNTKKIGCVSGTSAEQFVEENVMFPEIVLFDTNEEALAKLKSAEIAVAILEKDFAVPFVAESKDFGITDLSLSDENLVIVQRAFDIEITEFWKLHDEVGADI